MSDESRDVEKSGRKSGAPRKGFFNAAENPDRVPAMMLDELSVLLAAHCRHATTELPPGKPGVRWAADFLAALPDACCRRLPDVVATGPKIFEFLVGQGFFAAMPSPRLVPQVLSLVAGVSPILQARSSRQWVLWLARVSDPGSPVQTAIRKRTPAYLIGITTPSPAGRPLRSSQIRDERDHLATELANATEENRRRQVALAEALDDRDRLAVELAAAAEQERHAMASAATERDCLAAELRAAVERERHAVSAAAADKALLKRMEDKYDAFSAELAHFRVEYERMAKALVEAQGFSGEERVAEADAARRQAVAVADTLRVENSELRAERDALHGRCGKLESELQARTGTGALEVRVEKAERALATVRADLAAARRGAEVLTERLDRKRNLVHSLQKMMEAQELELAAVNAELAQWKAGMSGPLLVALARGRAIQAVRDAQARRPPMDADD